jgi:diadenosine tetraphosphate (Ap4A) HIT family hydrolase/ribosomal protein S18 acetylase RimI-like enzyme
MLVRWANESDLTAWYALATEVSEIFQHPECMGTELRNKASGKGSVSRYEMLTAVDYMSGNNMGFICFSRKENTITWFAVSERYRNKGVGERLLKTALRQLDTNKDIIVTTFNVEYLPGAAARALYKKYGFTIENSITHNGLPRSEMTRPVTNEKRSGSFHYNYPRFIKEAQKEYCPVCNNHPMPDEQSDIEINDNVWIVAEYPGQGRLFGKMYVMPRNHTFHFEDMAEHEAELFMREVRRVGRILRKVTGAVKINYEMHSNSGAHLHIHLFPRYLDDDFPGMAIDVHQKEPAPYESYEEFLWFVEQMRKELAYV